MSIRSLVSLALGLGVAMVSASPLQQQTKRSVATVPTCTSLNQRKAWSALTDTEKAAYIDAELCLMNKEATLGITGAKTRWDELQYLHIYSTPVVHYVGTFLPWHRYFVRTHEILLQQECGYTGAQPYWDELADVNAGTIEKASVLNATLGFGTGDVDSSGCIVNGPFVNMTLRMTTWDATTFDDYCLNRRLSQDGFDMALGSAGLDECMEYDTFEEARTCLEASPHGAGHLSIGGTMGNVYHSPGDPIFYLHHAYLDRAFWTWQQKDWPARETDISGYNYPGNNDSFTIFDLSAPYQDSFLDYNGDPSTTTTLDHVLYVMDFLPNTTISEVMDLNGDTICAEYI